MNITFDDIPAERLPATRQTRLVGMRSPAPAVTAAQNPAHFLAAQIDLIARSAQAESLQQALQLLVNEVQTFSGCQTAAMGLVSADQRFELQVISHVPKLDAASEPFRLFSEALQEGTDKGHELVWSASDAQGGLPAHAALGQSLAADWTLTAPLLNAQGRPLGMWTFVGSPQNVSASDFKAWISTCANVLGTHVELLQRAYESPWRRAIRAVIQLVRRKAVWLIMAAFIAAILACIEIPYHVTTSAVVEPVVKRFVVAPFQGQLERCLVRPGDLVQPGQALARMDGRDLRTELASQQAEFDQARKDYEVNLAKGNLADAQVAGLEMDRITQRIKLLSRRMEKLDIRSPVAGVVLSGDLEQSEDAPVNVGQTLFEVAPLDRLTCEVEIPDTEIAHVQVGQSLRIVLDAFPLRPIQGTVERIHPRSELREHSNVFIGIVTLENTQGELRPGMKGQVSIATAPQTLGWIALHKPWEYAASRLGW